MFVPAERSSAVLVLEPFSQHDTTQVCVSKSCPKLYVYKVSVTNKIGCVFLWCYTLGLYGCSERLYNAHVHSETYECAQSWIMC